VMTSVFNGSEVSMKQMGQSVPVEENMKKDMAFESAIISEIAVMDMGLQAELISVESIDGKNAYAVEVTKPSGSKTTYYYDAESGLKVRISDTIQSPQGEMVQERDFTDYRDVNGVMFPFSVSIPLGAMKVLSKAESIETNTGVSDDEFVIE